VSRALTWGVALVVGVAAVVGLIAVFNSRDSSGLAQQSAGPGAPYKGEPVLSPALEAAVKAGNVVVLYRDKRPSSPRQSAKALIDAGQGVVVDREPALGAAYAAISQNRIQLADDPARLGDFIDHWLGG
jgi:hypothetical protein